MALGHARSRRRPGRRPDPAVLAAQALFAGDPPRRWRLEAAILAGEDDTAAGARVGVVPGVVAAYHAVFYDVREKLGCTDWINAFAIGPAVYEGFDPGDLELVWKVLAYQFGPMALDHLLDPGLADRDPALAAELELLILVTATPVTPENALDFLRMHASYNSIRHSESARDATATMKLPVFRPPEVRIGPETVPLVGAGCAPEAHQGDKKAPNSVPGRLSGVG